MAVGFLKSNKKKQKKRKLSKIFRNIALRVINNRNGGKKELSNRELAQKKSIKKLLRIIDHLFVPAIHSEEVDRIEPLIDELDDQELSRLNKSSIMGLARLLIKKEVPHSAEKMLARYLKRPERSHRLLYFLEPLVELDRSGFLKDDFLRTFITSFENISCMTILNSLDKQYEGADDLDNRNFRECIIEPLRVVAKNSNNLMDIRFSAVQRATFQATIRASLVEERPLSLLRLGDGEAYPYSPPTTAGIDPVVFENDDKNFEASRTHWGISPPPGNSRNELIVRFRQAVAQCDILGFPSVYRIVRNLTNPHSRYGNRRNQRAFIRIFSALGKDIPIDKKIFTEERAHRIRGALDETFLVELAKLARAVVLVSCRPEVQSKFPRSLFIPVPSSGRELFKVYPSIVEKIREVSQPGTIVLIGAGVPAKIMTDEARQSGAVALDIGSLMDYMAGHKTRTIADLV